MSGLDGLPRDDTGRITSSYEPTPLEVEVARQAICREFGNNGTDGYYIRILKAIAAARASAPPAPDGLEPVAWRESLAYAGTPWFRGPQQRAGENKVGNAFRAIVEARSLLTLHEFEEFIRANLDKLGSQSFVASIGLAIARAARAESAEAEVTRLRKVVERAKELAVPSDISDAVLAIGRVEWGATYEKPDEDHVKDFTTTLRLTREHFNMDAIPVRMQGLYIEGSDIVVCHTGMSPNSAIHARALTGAWNHLHDLCAHQAAARQFADEVNRALQTKEQTNG